MKQGITPRQFKESRRGLNLSIRRAAKLFGCSTRTLRRWEAGTRDIAEDAVSMMLAMVGGLVTVDEAMEVAPEAAPD